jgi:Ca-activated chloride channel family protein
MKKTILFLFATILWSVGGGTEALADGMILPGALSPDYLAVRTHHVTVTIEDGHAVTRVEQEFYNPHDVPIVGHYLFPVPPEAMLSRFQAAVDGQDQEVARQDAAATNAALYAAMAQQHDPSLLQYSDWESLAFDLSLPPGGSRRMSLEYEQVLVPTGGLYHYRYVLSTERYSSQPLEEVSVTVDLQSSSGLATVYSSSHEVTTERLGAGRVRVSWVAQNANPAEDFELYFAPAEGGFGGGLLTGERDGQDHFLFLFSPETEPRQAAVLPKDILFVIDRSGSMAGEKIEQARSALHFILDQLGHDDRFTILSFNDQVSVWKQGLHQVDKGTVQEAGEYLDRLAADGSTDLEAALQTALEIHLGTPQRGALRTVVFLTDGLPTAGITDEALITRMVSQTNTAAEARLHVFGVGYDVNTRLLDRLAADSGGTVTYVQPGENLELALTDFFGKIAHPLLTDLEVEFEGLEATDLYPQTLPDLFEGSSLLLAGRYRIADQPAGDGMITVRVHGWAGNERREYVYHFDLEKTVGHDFVPRLWATRRVGALLDQVRVEGTSLALEAEIRELGLSYGIVTPYTTFVIEGQTDGAASTVNMDLYRLAEVNQATGQVTIQARVQNQMYQQAAQANLAAGANVLNSGGRSLAQVGMQQVDLSLLKGQGDLDGPINGEWIERHLEVDRTVQFGSEEYLKLAADPQLRPFLQSGPNVVFAYEGQIIAVRDPDVQTADSAVAETLAQTDASRPDRVPQARSSGAAGITALIPRLVTYGVVLLLGLLAGFGVCTTAVLALNRNRR